MSDAKQTPFEDLVKAALDRMEAGARIITDSIPGDTSLSSYSHGPDIGKAIAARIRLLEQHLSTAREEVEIRKRQVDILQAAMVAKKPIPLAFKKAIGEAAAIRSLGEKGLTSPDSASDSAG